MNSGGVAELAGRVCWGASGFDPYVGLRFFHCCHPCWPMAHREAWGVINEVKTFVVLACILASSSSDLIIVVAHRAGRTRTTSQSLAAAREDSNLTRPRRCGLQ